MKNISMSDENNHMLPAYLGIPLKLAGLLGFLVSVYYNNLILGIFSGFFIGGVVLPQMKIWVKTDAVTQRKLNHFKLGSLISTVIIFLAIAFVFLLAFSHIANSYA